MPTRQDFPWAWARMPLSIYAPIPAGTGAVEAVTDLVPGFAFQVEKATVAVAVAGTGAGANRTIRVLKGASTVVATGTLTLANAGTVGALVELTVTDDGAANAFEDADVLTVDFPSAGAVAFSAGAIMLILVLRAKPQHL
jgi:hypothetical protein